MDILGRLDPYYLAFLLTFSSVMAQNFHITQTVKNPISGVRMT
jgi:hypothetical protein